MAIRTGVETRTTFHNACTVRATEHDPATGWCLDHGVPTYRDGIDWHTDQDRFLPLVLNVHRSHDYTSDRVTVGVLRHPQVSDALLAEVAGYGTQHTGYQVTRYDDGTALVLLHND